MTFNVWHGLRGEGKKTRLAGEDPARKAQRFEWQIELIREVDPDVLLLQEVNPNARETRRYAETLGYDRISKVTSCGIHVPPIKIPTNMNDGLAILARPELGLRRVGKKRLSGNAKCSASFGFQTNESRYVLLGEIVVDGRSVLLVTTHLSSPPFVLSDFESNLDRLVAEGVLAADQRDEIVATLERKRTRNFSEVEKVLTQIDKRLGNSAWAGRRERVILGGDFNTEPKTPSIARLEEAGFVNLTSRSELPTWDPIKNHVNQGIGGRTRPPLPTFEIAEVEALLEPRDTTPRQIDFIFLSGSLDAVSTEMAMNRDREGLFPSDHFALLSVVRLVIEADSRGSGQ
jgi:endonuclease/exonuclease/phosphatase family metal-dependent hydrolase